MDVLRSSKSRSSSQSSFKKTDSQRVVKSAWTDSLETVFDINSEDSKKRTVVKVKQSEADIVNSFLGLIDGYKEKIEALELENKKLKEEICQKKESQMSLPLLPVENVPQ